LLFKLYIPENPVKKGYGKACDLKQIFLFHVHLCSDLKVKKSGCTRRCFETRNFVKLGKRRIESIGGGREGRIFFSKKSF
jgi:hypothetical protein